MATSVSHHHTTGLGWRLRATAAGIHLLLSALVAALAAALVFGLWYPWPFRELSGGRELFLLVVSVDVAIGPLITFAVYNLAKPRRELRRDLAVVALLQLAALGYGLWTVHQARPVHMVFEYDRLRVVHLVDIPPELQAEVPEGIELAPLTGPTPLALRQFRTPDEKLRFTMDALQGLSLSARTELWRPYAVERQHVLAAARPVETLYARFPASKALLDEAVRQSGRPVGQLVFLPMVARRAVAWTALLDAQSADIVGYLPLDPF